MCRWTGPTPVCASRRDVNLQLTQSPPTQVRFALQIIPHVPQLLRSVWRSTQGPPLVHTTRPALHAHCWFTQSSVAASQSLPQVPQCCGLLEMSSQPLPQSSVPNGHSQVPPAHSVPPVQTV